MDSLSLKCKGSGSRINVVGADQPAPPVLDLATNNAESTSSPEIEREIWYALPAGSNVTQGSEARSYELLAGLPEQVENAAKFLAQVVPPSPDRAVTSPREPPSDHRSCWKTPMTLFELVGLTATNGSTSASG